MHKGPSGTLPRITGDELLERLRPAAPVQPETLAARPGDRRPSGGDGDPPPQRPSYSVSRKSSSRRQFRNRSRDPCLGLSRYRRSVQGPRSDLLAGVRGAWRPRRAQFNSSEQPGPEFAVHPATGEESRDAADASMTPGMAPGAVPRDHLAEQLVQCRAVAAERGQRAPGDPPRLPPGTGTMPARARSLRPGRGLRSSWPRTSPGEHPPHRLAHPRRLVAERSAHIEQGAGQLEGTGEVTVLGREEYGTGEQVRQPQGGFLTARGSGRCEGDCFSGPARETSRRAGPRGSVPRASGQSPGLRHGPLERTDLQSGGPRTARGPAVPPAPAARSTRGAGNPSRRGPARRRAPPRSPGRAGPSSRRRGSAEPPHERVGPPSRVEPIGLLPRRRDSDARPGEP